jgi:GNAT superfamily N-acetyltransferase
MTETVSYRRAETRDIRSVYELFYRSLYDYLFRIAMVDESSAKNPPISSGWNRHSAWFNHLWASAAENWIAEDERGIVGWAMSIVRDRHLELTHCFVEPGLQAKGIGGNLVRYAFPDNLASHKAIIATQDPRAMAVYLRSGVNFVTTSAELIVKASGAEPATNLVFRSVDADDATAVEAIAAMELAILGYRRDIDTRFLLRSRPA